MKKNWRKWGILCFTLLSLCMCLGIIQGRQIKAASDFVISNGTLVEYTGNSSSVTVPSSVKKIGASAFEGNTTVTYVSLPNNLTEIGAQAFKDCTKLRTVSCKDKIKTIEVKAFSGCVALTSIHFSSTLEKIGNRAFYDCRTLGYASLPKNLR